MKYSFGSIDSIRLAAIFAAIKVIARDRTDWEMVGIVPISLRLIDTLIVVFIIVLRF